MDGYIEKLKTLPFVSIILVTVNVGVFFFCQLPGSILYAKGCLRTYEVIGYGEYGRILWAMFLHADVNHLFSNMIILLFMGAMIEKAIGHVPYLAIYMMSGLIGNMLSLFGKLMSNDLTASLGASGAIFGLDGLLLAMVLFSRKRVQNVTPMRVVLMICLSLYSGFSGGNVDNLAHVGGLMAGFLIGMIYLICRRIFTE
ncbi:MAG: rhomboid family intramembrane serine protease [Acetatifactor sp.]|nr:rhomboid family intramembrane serine protease [Acetatifactor sp.]